MFHALIKSRPAKICLAVGLAALSHTVDADEFATDATFYRQLLKPMTSVIDGKPYRDALEQVAGQARVNIWLDRRVDPTADVNAGRLGPDVYSAIKQLAQQRDCVVMPVAGVLLVGRATWVDATAAALMQLTESADSTSKKTISWDALATPGEALAQAAGDLQIPLMLPHDLWPATRWTGIDRRVATTLVLAQFDRRPSQESFSSNKLAVVPIDSNRQCNRVYRTANQAALLRETITDADSKSNVKVVRTSFNVAATATAHRLATNALMQGLAKQGAPKPHEDHRQFSLELKALAGEAIQQFAKTANIACVIEPNAEENCRTRVTLSAKQKTLRELIDMVAKEAKLKATWHPNKVVISK